MPAALYTTNLHRKPDNEESEKKPGYSGIAVRVRGPQLVFNLRQKIELTGDQDLSIRFELRDLICSMGAGSQHQEMLPTG